MGKQKGIEGNKENSRERERDYGLSISCQETRQPLSIGVVRNSMHHTLEEQKRLFFFK